MTESKQVPEPRAASAGLYLGRPFGIPVYLAPSLFVLVALIAYLVVFGIPQLQQSGSTRIVVGLSFALLLVASVLVHELGHSVVARAYGLPVRRITLYALGGYSEIEREPQTPGREFLVAFAGPLVSLALAGAGLLASPLVPQTAVATVLLGLFWKANLAIGIFNLLPGLPLDGGRILRAGVWRLSRDLSTATLTAAWAGRGLALTIAAIPLLGALLTGGSQDLIGSLWLLFIAAFIWFSASQSLRSLRVRQRLPSVRARALARRAIAVPGDMPLAEGVRRAREAQAGALVVVDHAGAPIAIVNEAAVLATPEHRQPWVNVGTVSRTLEPGLVLAADLEGEALLEAMRHAPAQEYLLVDRGGEIYGVLATADVDRAFAGV